MKNVCKNICVNLNDGICMGLCSTDPDFVQNFYDEKKTEAIKRGDSWEIIPELDRDSKVKNDNKENVEQDRKNLSGPKF